MVGLKGKKKEKKSKEALSPRFLTVFYFFSPSLLWFVVARKKNKENLSCMC
jgi:hypothetical protein